MKELRIARLKELIAQDPSDSFSHYALALEPAGMGNPAEAMTILENLVQRDPDYLPAYQQLGFLCEQRSLRDRAIIFLERGLKLAQVQGDQHAHDEIRQALENLTS